MCTVLTIDSENLFGRTMDFPPRTPWKLTYLPRNYKWKPASKLGIVDDKYAILGGMREVEGHWLIGDGINEAGLICAELFFPVAASYPQKVEGGNTGLTPQDFIHWTLANYASVAELAADLPNISVIQKRWYDGEQYPFHWLLMDDTGTYGIEPLDGKLVLFKNEVGAFTNTPSFSTHISKLNRFLQLGDKNEFSGETKAALVNSNEEITGRNSVDRFILAAKARWGEQVKTGKQVGDFLKKVTVPNVPAHAHNYTHYRAIINRKRREYSFNDLHTGTTESYRLDDLLSRFTQPHRFNV